MWECFEEAWAGENGTRPVKAEMEGGEDDAGPLALTWEEAAEIGERAPQLDDSQVQDPYMPDGQAVDELPNEQSDPPEIVNIGSPIPATQPDVVTPDKHAEQAPTELAEGPGLHAPAGLGSMPPPAPVAMNQKRVDRMEKRSQRAEIEKRMQEIRLGPTSF